MPDASFTLGISSSFTPEDAPSVVLESDMDPSDTHRRLVDSLQRLCAREGGFKTVATLANVSPDNLWQVLNGTLLPSGKPRGIGSRVAAKLDAAFPDWMDSQHSPRGADLKGVVSQVLRHPPIQHSPLITWGENMLEDLPATFRVAMPDDSMAPRVRAGQIVEFATGQTPRPDDGVLVADSAGALYFRQYRERRAGQWEAYPLNDAYLPLEAERDGLRVLAVLTAVHARWG